MVLNEAMNVEESVEMNDLANEGAENTFQNCEREDDPRTRVQTRSLAAVTLRAVVTRPFCHSTRRDFETIVSVAEACDHVDSSHRPPQSSARGIKIENLDRVFSSFLFASEEQKQDLLRIAREHDENRDGKLSRDEYDRMKDHLREDRPDLYKIFVAVPERYTRVPVFVLSTASLIVCVMVFHAIHYHNHHSDQWFTSNFTGKSYPKCSHLIYDVDRKAEVWRALSYAYAHADVGHCLLNVVMLLVVGVPLEMVHGAARVAAVWFVGSIGGVAGFALLGTGSSVEFV